MKFIYVMPRRLFDRNMGGTPALGQRVLKVDQDFFPRKKVAARGSGFLFKNTSGYRYLK